MASKKTEDTKKPFADPRLAQHCKDDVCKECHRYKRQVHTKKPTWDETDGTWPGMGSEVDCPDCNKKECEVVSCPGVVWGCGGYSISKCYASLHRGFCMDCATQLYHWHNHEKPRLDAEQDKEVNVEDLGDEDFA
jgi:hypothetical protein